MTPLPIINHQSPVTIHNFLGALIAALLVIAFSLALLAHDPLVFWNDDYQISVLPVCADIARAWNYGEFPLLSPYSWVCGNLAGEFQYGIFSAFINAAIICIWKLPLTFPQQAAALSITHLAVLSAGAFLLARDRLSRLNDLDSSPAGFQNKCSRDAIRESRIASQSNRALHKGNGSIALSIFVALVTSLSGWIICWGATDWLGALGAFTWLPWCWWAAERALDSNRSRWRFLWPAPFVYLLVTGGFPYTVLMLALVLGWLAAREFVHRPRLTRIMPLGFGVALGIGLAAPAWLALFAYIPGSARAVQNPSAHFQWLVPWNAWPGLILPPWTVTWTNFWTQSQAHGATELTCGLVPPAALIAGFLRHGRELFKKIRWEIVLLIVVLILAMIPTAGVFRWSFRWLPLFHLVLALCAAEALQFTAARAESAELKQKKKFSAFSANSAVNMPLVAFICVLVVMLAAKIFHAAGEHLFPLTWILLALTAIWFLGLRFNFSARWIAPVITFAALLATYLSLPTNCGVPKFNLAQSLLQSAPLDPQRLYLSVYPPPEIDYRTEAKPNPIGQTVRPGSTSIWAGLRFVNGYSPIRPAGAAREFASSIHGEIDPSLAEWLLAHEGQSDGLLARIGIDGIIVAREFNFRPQPVGEWNLVSSDDEGRVFHRRTGPLARVRSMNFGGQNARAGISHIVESRNSVSATIKVPGGANPALIAFSRPFFPGYKARLDGKPLPVSSIRNLYPMVEVPAGSEGTLRLYYRPTCLIYGAALALLSAFIYAISLVCAILTNRRFAKSSSDRAEIAS